jgi:hypothetical protein
LLIISPKVRLKLSQADHNVSQDEILQCFANRNREFGDCFDTRAHHATNPLTRWFVAETDYGRTVKVCYMLHSNGDVEIKTAYPASQHIINIYNKYAPK